MKSNVVIRLTAIMFCCSLVSSVAYAVDGKTGQCSNSEHSFNGSTYSSSSECHSLREKHADTFHNGDMSVVGCI
jgi:hypothetical protein